MLIYYTGALNHCDSVIKTERKMLAEGLIGLQAEGQSIALREIKIKEL
ncbi:hypothetical protein [Flavivirga spongiicola]|uniref:Uncharacterized protein n=1 Tax=Flavivirga spongiicola TaxID=421621 RepID=A0ABU7XY23_9FLAO|nr:hypothetical protein [Flavivirga sp. MEBiC05379]MDO5980300.1 hypothetical protein [Flavivirga sp. MEBiC05379]